MRSSPKLLRLVVAPHRRIRLWLRLRFYLIVLRVAARLPLSIGYAVARLVGRLRYRFRPRPLHVNADVMRALGAAPAQVEGWARQNCELRASGELEASRYPRMSREAFARLIRIEGLENLDAALAKGRGALLYSCHSWSSHTFFGALAALGYPPTIVGYPPGRELAPAERSFLRRRAAALEKRFGCRFIWMQAGNLGVAVKAANVLRRNGIVVMLVDFPHRKSAVEVRFLEHRSSFTLGPAFVAKEIGAPLLDFFIHREKGWFPQVAEIGAPFWVQGNPEEAAQECASMLEPHVRRDPAAWTRLWER